MITMEPYEKTFSRQWVDEPIEMVIQIEWNLHTTMSGNEIKHLMALIKRRHGRWQYDREHATPPS